MDHVGPIPAVLPPAGKFLVISAIALTFYDYVLLFDDEIRYVWKGRKTWIFYLYILNRIVLLGYQLWQLYSTSNPNSKPLPPGGLYTQMAIVMFFLFSSDIFITLRVYAITLGNKILVVYFGTLALARLTMAFVTALVRPSAPLPLQFRLVPNTIGTTFEISAILVIFFYTFRNKGSLRFSAVVYTIMTESTIYFLAMVAAQIYVQISFSLIKGPQLSVLAYGLFNPILTLRFAISLRKAANPEGEQQWGVTHFNTPRFSGLVSPGVQVPAVYENFIEMDAVDSPPGRAQMSELRRSVMDV